MGDHVYAVLGAGRQGTAAAYDLVVRGGATRILVGDVDAASARTAAERVDRLAGRAIAEPVGVDARDPEAVRRFLTPVDGFLSAVPFHLNLGITHAAIEAGAHMVDLGGKTDIVFEQLELDVRARGAGVTVVPDCGMVPGLGTSVCVRSMELVEEPEHVLLYDGGLPQHPVDPWRYVLTFHFEGLVNEYWGTTEFLRGGEIVEVGCFEEYELVDFPEPLGTLEAFTTAGGTSTAPRTFRGRLSTYQNKTLRYPGHFAQWKAFRDAGLLDPESVAVRGGGRVRPRDLLEAVLDPRIRARPEDHDVCIIRARTLGRSGGRPVEATVDLFDYFDPDTGFTAMERTTGWHAAIVLAAAVRGEIPRGVVPVERALGGARVVEECRARGMQVDERGA